MTFEEVMMVRNHGWRRDVAITDKVTATSTSSTLTVRWGQRGRVGEGTIKPRAQFVVEQLAPWVLQADPAAVSALPAPIPMRPGESWNANLVLPAPPSGLATSAGACGPAAVDRTRSDAAATRPVAPGDRHVRVGVVALDAERALAQAHRALTRRESTARRPPQCAAGDARCARLPHNRANFSPAAP